MLCLPYTWVDVFAPAPLQGNQLAVFQAPPGLTDELMGRITRELNHSETTFLQPATVPGADVRVRIFIPTPSGAQEIPFAGHPVLGSACAAAMGAQGVQTLRVEVGAGVLPVDVTPSGPGLWQARMLQPLPRVVRTLEPSVRGALAEALGLTGADLRGDVPVEAVDNGMQTVIIPVTAVAAVQRAVPDMARLRGLLGRDGLCTLIFALGSVEPGTDVHCRVFSPFDQVGEDPATGSANGPLGEYLVRHGLLPGPRVESEQGYVIGRPSRLSIEVAREAGATRAVHVSGQVRLVGLGEFSL
jgi:trans-2,3-dihydro-3-hydroxyanthranilate isomerase